MLDRNGSPPRARFVLSPEALRLVYPPAVRREIERQVTCVGEPCTGADVEADPTLLTGVQLLFTGWGGPRLTQRLLDAAPDLQVVFHGAGSVRGVMTDAAWRRGVRVTSAVATNAIPVVEFTVAQVVFCLKRVWQHVNELKTSRAWVQSDPGATGFGSTIGIVSLGEIGQRVVERLAAMDVELLAYDPLRDPSLERRLRLRHVELAELFAVSDVVTLHTPLLPETRGMIGEALLRSMKPGASLINTARGGIIDQPALVRVLRDRPDLFAALDVTDPEPPAPDDPLWDLPNVVLTPHIAGSRGRECERMGRRIVEELNRHLAGEPLRWAVCPQRASTLA